MDGLECSEVMLSEIDLGDRMDAEYFSKSSVNIVHRLSHVKTLKIGEVASAVASAFYPAATQLYSVGNLPFVRCVDCVNYPVITRDQDSTFEKIPRSFAVENKGVSILQRYEILITKVGTPCYASIVDDYDEVALSRTVMGLKNIHGIDPYYLLVFLRCKYGFGQLYRQREQTIQYQLTLPRVKDVDVFIPSREFQMTIKDIVKEYCSGMRKSTRLYASAQEKLNEELHFDRNDISHENITTKSLSDTFSAGRLDAEYFMPKYDFLFSLLSKLPTQRLGELVSITKSIEPGSECYGQEGIPFIRVSDISKMGITEPSIRIPENIIPNLEALYPREDTILLSKDGSIGIAYKVREDMRAVTSGALLHLRVKDASVLPDYLTLVLNSEIVQLQAERDSNGAIIQHWKPYDIANVIIPVMPHDIQQEISDSVRESFRLRKESERMINLAVKSVELAIESNEESAINLIKEQMNQ